MPADPTLDRLANATLLVPFESTAAPRWLLDGLADGIAGVCLFHNNIDLSDGPEALKGLTRALSEAGGDPLVSLDEEGGDVTRIGQAAGSGYPGNAALGAVDDTALTEAVHTALGAELRGLGLNVDLAPSVDVNTAADNPVIGTRSFGSDAALVARHGAAAVRGLQAAGVAAAAKHFPGHGATELDSHLDLPSVDASAELLRERELRPFRAAVEAGALAVLTAHITLPSLGVDGPATLSRRALVEVLRGELGFTGMVISDALDMDGVRRPIGMPEAAVRALEAGCDLLCLGRYSYADEVAAVRAAVTEAVRSGRMPAERLEEAAARTAGVRRWTAAQGAPPQIPSDLGLDGARRAVQVVGEPLAPADLAEPVVVELDAPPGIAVGEVPWGLSPWFPQAERITAEEDSPSRVLARASGRPLVAVVRDAHRFPATREFVAALCRERPDAVVVEMGLPVWRPECRTHIRSHGAARVNGQSVAELLGGVPTPVR
ncbi:glycoside hydrolase family 3 protein [Nocardiopsis sp. RSe5-2]|uniref:Glycoside hydrolase family 3 protein n=1 Tax=Nocardiopsis endophytica TaxID=3018445 RepID=A0ABT4UDK6_9ACTN|nr:glycoside hydrolase family 3 N-terminal domain-containing protein [Nocardiopsis endophytica]MDA2815064.1 glycoside hydrolase family 3 protein [Nocardiopsis endophytica]